MSRSLADPSLLAPLSTSVQNPILLPGASSAISVSQKLAASKRQSLKSSPPLTMGNSIRATSVSGSVSAKNLEKPDEQGRTVLLGSDFSVSKGNMTASKTLTHSLAESKALTSSSMRQSHGQQADGRPLTGSILPNSLASKALTHSTMGQSRASKSMATSKALTNSSTRHSAVQPVEAPDSPFPSPPLCPMPLRDSPFPSPSLDPFRSDFVGRQSEALTHTDMRQSRGSSKMQNSMTASKALTHNATVYSGVQQVEGPESLPASPPLSPLLSQQVSSVEEAEEGEKGTSERERESPFANPLPVPAGPFDASEMGGEEEERETEKEEEDGDRETREGEEEGEGEAQEGEEGEGEEGEMDGDGVPREEEEEGKEEEEEWPGEGEEKEEEEQEGDAAKAEEDGQDEKEEGEAEREEEEEGEEAREERGPEDAEEKKGEDEQDEDEEEKQEEEEEEEEEEQPEEEEEDERDSSLRPVRGKRRPATQEISEEELERAALQALVSDFIVRNIREEPEGGGGEGGSSCVVWNGKTKREVEAEFCLDRNLENLWLIVQKDADGSLASGYREKGRESFAAPLPIASLESLREVPLPLPTDTETTRRESELETRRPSGDKTEEDFRGGLRLQFGVGDGHSGPAEASLLSLASLNILKIREKGKGGDGSNEQKRGSRSLRSLSRSLKEEGEEEECQAPRRVVRVVFVFGSEEERRRFGVCMRILSMFKEGSGDV
uniref:Uncharacterized protein n=1 Tax=Chromera velia CCMP2878 TaxID=1169474 RepID=A0A0G4IAQ3_9ALVE|eukprot:Cvel_12628.t1-p1 / transcript=Cvel_12628.t1 / gene=Cvel_12628 / organism=Chromera_velia_CCMP2878 / gene_product=hypothetical protein / transcript_product=hypothetical protein / location=Cvel_scaffold833:40021-44292(-) / protein_length=722 / sequence_SO=supercontig / SO=protein_coding / is_pseudo=false